MSQTSSLGTPADRNVVAGHRGMAGSVISRSRSLSARRRNLDLHDPTGDPRWLAEDQPTVVVSAAAKLKGIHSEAACPADFVLENLGLLVHLIETAMQSGLSLLRPQQEASARVAYRKTGTLLRELLDFKSAFVFMLEKLRPKALSARCDSPRERDVLRHIEAVTATAIDALVETEAATRRFAGEIIWGASKPDGTSKDQLELSWLDFLDWWVRIPPDGQLSTTLAAFCADPRQEQVWL